MVVTLSRMAMNSNLVQQIVRHNPATPIALLALNPSEVRRCPRPTLAACHLAPRVPLGLRGDQRRSAEIRSGSAGGPTPTRAQLVNLSPQIDASMRLNVNKRLMWETAKAGGMQVEGAPAGSLQDAWVWPFMWHGQPSLFTAMFKAVEDRLNVKADIEYGVQTILVVEDSVQFYSSFLPVLYSELWRHNKSLQAETMHTRERMLRMQSRPKVCAPLGPPPAARRPPPANHHLPPATYHQLPAARWLGASRAHARTGRPHVSPAAPLHRSSSAPTSRRRSTSTTGTART